MLAIKLQRIGKIHQPSFRVVVAEKRSKLGGAPVEDLGFYDPFTKKASLNKDRVLYWLKVGAQSTVTTHNLLVKEGIVPGLKVKIKIKAKHEKEEQKGALQETVTARAGSEEGQKTG